jgi:predicted ATPase
MFKHALTHDVAYQTLLERERRVLHGKVPGLIETLYADRLPEFYETLAYQYERADVPERAAHYAMLAGQRAARQLAPEALQHFRRAAALAKGRDACADLFVRAQAALGDYLIRRADVEGANQAYAEAMEVSEDAATRLASEEGRSPPLPRARRRPARLLRARRGRIRVDRIRHMVAQIPGAQFALIKRASHMAPFSAIETFREIVTTFTRTGTLPREMWEP